MKIGVLMGGFSSEREVSLRSGQAVAGALRSLNHEVVEVDIQDERASALDAVPIDVAFIAMHGRFGEDGTLQELLQKRGIPYTGSGPEACRQAMDKVAAKKLFVKNHIPTPDWRIVHAEAPPDDLYAIAEMLGYPVVLKPRAEGSSVGVSIHSDELSLSEGFELACRYGPEVVVEKYIKGIELTVGILDDAPLPIIKLQPRRRFYDYVAKYQDHGTEYLVNPALAESSAEQTRQAALRAHQVLGCSIVSRVDVILSADGVPFVLEVNTIPGCTERSLLPKAAAAAGIPFPQLCQRIVDLAIKKHS